jgi:hypothetical protein
MVDFSKTEHPKGKEVECHERAWIKSRVGSLSSGGWGYLTGEHSFTSHSAQNSVREIRVATRVHE